MVVEWQSLAIREEASPEPSPPLFDDLSSLFLDSFPDFDPVKEWLIDPDTNPMSVEESMGPKRDGSDPTRVEPELPKEEVAQNGLYLDGFGVGKTESALQNESLGSSIDGQMEQVCVRVEVQGQESPNSDGLGSGKIKLEMENENLSSSIDEKMEKVRLVEGADASNEVGSISMGNGNGNDISLVASGEGEERNGPTNSLMEKERDDGVHEVCSVSDSIKMAHGSSEESSETETDQSEIDDSSSNSTSLSSEEEDEEEEQEEESKGRESDEVLEVEEGEIRGYDQKEVFCSDDDENEIPKGPIKSKHEIEILPLVPRVEVSLEPQHRMLPVGVISSILGNRVIVEGSVNHNPLNEGSILWITETRSPLGLVDEVFGPVKNPYYIIRYNSENEVPVGITVGTAASFVIEFADHILNMRDLYKKGYDASGDNDEEVTDEVEFSDDEKEAEYRRSLRQSKRATHANQQHGTSKKKAYFNDRRQPQMPTRPPSVASIGEPLPLPSHSGHLQAPLAAGNFGCGSCNCSHGVGNPSASAPSPMVPPIPQAFQMGSGCFGDPSQHLNAVLAQEFQFQPQQMGMQGGFLVNWFTGQHLGDQAYHVNHQNQVLNNFAAGIIPYEQQLQQQQQQQQRLIPGERPWLGVPPNLSIGPSALVGPVALDRFGQAPFGSGNVSAHGTLGSCGGHSHGQPPSPAAVEGRMNPPLTQINHQGRPSFRGRMPYQRGNRHSFGGRGGHR